MILAILLSCVPHKEMIEEAPAAMYDEDSSDEGASSGVLFTLYTVGGEPVEELFYEICESQHAIAYVSAHAVGKAAAKELLDRFEERIYPALPMGAEHRILVLLTYMEGQIYGYTSVSGPEQGPTVCLNALYPDDLSYTLAHEYQHLCARAACEDGKTTLSEETDELLSDVFCETLFPYQGKERGILTEQRAEITIKSVMTWGEDAVSYAHQLLREGYTEEMMLVMMENRRK